MGAYSNSSTQSFLKNQQLFSYSKIPLHLQKLKVQSLVHNSWLRIGISSQTLGIIQPRNFRLCKARRIYGVIGNHELLMKAIYRGLPIQNVIFCQNWVYIATVKKLSNFGLGSTSSSPGPLKVETFKSITLKRSLSKNHRKIVKSRFTKILLK
jgi:hypothetical protein